MCRRFGRRRRPVMRGLSAVWVFFMRGARVWLGMRRRGPAGCARRRSRGMLMRSMIWGCCMRGGRELRRMRRRRCFGFTRRGIRGIRGLWRRSAIWVSCTERLFFVALCRGRGCSSPAFLCPAAGRGVSRGVAEGRGEGRLCLGGGVSVGGCCKGSKAGSSAELPALAGVRCLPAVWVYLLMMRTFSERP